MASFESEGMDEFIHLCQVTDRRLKSVIGRSIHPGAKIMANAIKQAVNGIPVDDNKSHKRKRQGITSIQKAGLVESMGIARIRENSTGWNVKVGFDGYNKVVTKRWPKGQPNAMIARSINSGTSFMIKYPFMDQTVRANEARVVDRIEEEFSKELEKVWDYMLTRE